MIILNSSFEIIFLLYFQSIQQVFTQCANGGSLQEHTVHLSFCGDNKSPTFILRFPNMHLCSDSFELLVESIVLLSSGQRQSMGQQLSLLENYQLLNQSQKLNVFNSRFPINWNAAFSNVVSVVEFNVAINFLTMLVLRCWFIFKSFLTVTCVAHSSHINLFPFMIRFISIFTCHQFLQLIAQVTKLSIKIQKNIKTRLFYTANSFLRTAAIWFILINTFHARFFFTSPKKLRAIDVSAVKSRRKILVTTSFTCATLSRQSSD